MPKGVKPSPNFHGKKGRSGRKSKADEALKNDVIYKAWLKKQKRMNDSEATQIVLKDMVEKQDMNVKGDVYLNVPKEEEEAIKNYGEYSKTN
tara:strand:+ start:412 stop:687 length:276 start_codon:yes stop_codon:yes gene_type:complete